MIDKTSVKRFIEKHKRFAKFVINLFNKMPFNNSIRIQQHNNIKCDGLLKSCYIKINGKGNTIIIGGMARIVDSKISITGNNNTITIGESAYIEDGNFCMEDDDGFICIGKHTIISGHTHLAEIEGTRIDIGDNCLFSANITIRTGDSHSIIDQNTKKRINISKSVKVGNHVWIGNGATILKGVAIPDDCVVGSCAVVTHSPADPHCVMAGNPAKMVKTGISWAAERNI